MHKPFRAPRFACLMALFLLVACGPLGDPSRPIPTVLASAPDEATRLVVILPGRADDLDALQESGMVEAIQGAWPDADVLLAELAIAYYRNGDAPRRLHDEVIAPARARGYREIWLGGASMGGMGTLLYDQAYPGEIDGMILLAPYLGDRAILSQIMAAGGVARWDPGPSQTLSEDTWQHELWRHLKTWGDDPALARNVWLAYGDDDRLREAMPVLTPLLRPEQVLVYDGGHDWTVWAPATGEILRRVDASRERSGGSRRQDTGRITRWSALHGTITSRRRSQRRLDILRQ